METMEGEAAVAVTFEKPSWFSNAPWWMISFGLHLVLLLGATVWIIKDLAARESDGEMIVAMSKAKTVIPQSDPPRDLIGRKGIITDEPNTFQTNEPVIIFPEAQPSDKNRSDDDELGDSMKGQSLDARSYLPGDDSGFRGRQKGTGPGVYDVMGTGPGGGSAKRYGDRIGSNRNTRAVGSCTQATESAVLAALKWLAHHQNPDGSWGASGFQGQCAGAKCSGCGSGDFDTGVTGLSLLAFLGAGYTHLSRDEFDDPISPGRKLRFGETVKQAVKWLTAHQDPAGCIGERGVKYMYNHAVAALALCEAYGMTAAALLKDPAQKGVDFIVAAQNPGKGWRYGAKSGDNDTSVTGWCVMVLKSAELSELVFPQACYAGALAWLDEVTDASGYYHVGYNAKGTGVVFVQGRNESFAGHPAMQAVAVMSRIFINKKKSDPYLGSANALVADLPQWGENQTDFYYWYYGSLALFQYDGPDGALWRKWNEPMKNALVPNQKTGKDGCRNGSWDPEQERWGFEGGRVYATAINALTLEVYYRYANVFGGTGGAPRK